MLCAVSKKCNITAFLPVPWGRVRKSFQVDEYFICFQWCVQFAVWKEDPECAVGKYHGSLSNYYINLEIKHYMTRVKTNLFI